MGRTAQSQGLAPPSVRKDLRAKQARHIVNKIVPAILASSARARKGVEGSELIVEPESGEVGREKEKDEGRGGDTKYIKRKGQGRRRTKERGIGTLDAEKETNDAYSPGNRVTKADIIAQSKKKDTASNSNSRPTSNPPLKIRILHTDTLTASRNLVSRGKSARPNPCILNMASPLRPGGGTLAGATSQEESLCARTTLLPALKDAFYRLPERGGVFTHDVLVFREPRLGLGDARGELGSAERWWVDVVSAGMLRFPELEEGWDGEMRLGRRDRALVEGKMRAVLRIVCARGVERLVLGAWGCGAYGNPVRDVAEAWRRVLLSSSSRSDAQKLNKGQTEDWAGLQEVVFAISSRKMAEGFARAFGGGIEVEDGPASNSNDEVEEEVDEVAEELRRKIAEMEGQIEQVWRNRELKERMGVILSGLRAQLKEREEVESDDGGENYVEESLSEKADEDDSNDENGDGSLVF